MTQHLLRLRAVCCAAVAVAAAAGSHTEAAHAAEIRTYDKTGTYADVRADLVDAIVNRGLVSDHAGNIAGMLERTGADVGSTKPVYKAAEYMTFCSAKLSRAMMEVNPANMAFCPFTMFVFERAEKPGTVTVGYRRPEATPGDAATKAVLDDIDKLLDQIAREATR